eukprot:883333-Rhodomonas_salina.2
MKLSRETISISKIASAKTLPRSPGSGNPRRASLSKIVSVFLGVAAIAAILLTSFKGQEMSGGRGGGGGGGSVGGGGAGAGDARWRNPSTLKDQLEYYFSEDNLNKDKFLSQKLDREGFCDVRVLSEFPRVLHLTGQNAFNSSVEKAVSDAATNSPVSPPLVWQLCARTMRTLK